MLRVFSEISLKQNIDGRQHSWFLKRTYSEWKRSMLGELFNITVVGKKHLRFTWRYSRKMCLRNTTLQMKTFSDCPNVTQILKANPCLSFISSCVSMRNDSFMHWAKWLKTQLIKIWTQQLPKDWTELVVTDRLVIWKESVSDGGDVFLYSAPNHDRFMI